MIAALAAEFVAILALLIGVLSFVFLSEPLSYGHGERLAQDVAEWAIPLAGVLPCVLAGWWAGRKPETNATQQGLSVGLIAAMLDTAFLVWLGAPFRYLFLLSAIGRVGGGALGGQIASRRSCRKATRAYAKP